MKGLVCQQQLLTNRISHIAHKYAEISAYDIITSNLYGWGSLTLVIQKGLGVIGFQINTQMYIPTTDQHNNNKNPRKFLERFGDSLEMEHYGA